MALRTMPSPLPAPFVPGTPLADRPGVHVLERPLFARVLGQGPPLLLIHGLVVSGELLAPIAEQLAVSHQLLIPELPGQGRSASLLGPYSAQRMANDLAALLTHLQVRHATVLGYSHGGPIALQLAHAYPELVGRLMLACTYACNRVSRRERLEGKLLPWLFRLLGPRAMGAITRRRPALTGGQPLTTAQAAFVGRLIAVPTLVVAGANDGAVPAHHARMLAQGIAGAVFQEIPDAGHLLICTHPAALLARIANWEAALR
jgi:3-oxoadipate enol-lactonase